MQQSLEQLSALGELSPQALLEQLERELQRNRPMRRELDDITRQTLQQAQLDLRRDAQAERDTAERLELADAQTVKANDPLVEQLKRIAERSRELADKEIPTLAKDGRPATAGRLDEPLNLATADLRSASEQAGQAADPQLSSTARMRRAAPLAQTLDGSADDLDEAALRARSVKEQLDAKRKAHEAATAEVEAAKKTAAETARRSAEAQRQAQKTTDERQRKRREAEALQSQATQAARQAAAKTQDEALAKAAADAKQQAEEDTRRRERPNRPCNKRLPQPTRQNKPLVQPSSSWIPPSAVSAVLNRRRLRKRSVKAGLKPFVCASRIRPPRPGNWPRKSAR